jgi:Iap family predicted aminopeptidase
VRLIEELGVEIGERLCGSPAAARAAEVVAAAFRDLGLQTRFQEFEFLGYEPEEPELEVEGEPWAAGPCMYSASTRDGWVEGRIRHVGTNVWAKGFFEVPVFVLEDGDGREVGRLSGNPFDGGAIPFVVAYGHILGGPQVWISTADSKRLEALEGASARLRVGGRLVPGQWERNVLAELPGECEETVIVCAHYDSVWRSPGVVDNATGVEGVRRIAERLAGRKLPRTVLFAAWAAEEIALQGSRWFVEEARIRGELDRIAGVVNLDCIGHGEYLELLVGPDELRGRALQLVHQLGLSERYELRVFPPVGGTDHFWFAQNGIPAASILHFPYPEYHLPTERIELIDEARVEDAVELALALVEGQLEHPVARAH